jgi:hypothetical protein
MAQVMMGSKNGSFECAAHQAGSMLRVASAELTFLSNVVALGRFFVYCSVLN